MLTVIKPFSMEFSRESRMDNVVSAALADIEAEYILTAEELEKKDLKRKKILFAICLSGAGINTEYYRMLEYFRRNPQSLKDAIAAVIVDGGGEMYTKSLARRLVFSANMSGCTFIGKSLVEATGSLNNFNVISKVLGTDNMGAYYEQAELLVKRLLEFTMPKKERNELLMVHAGSRNTSNSLLLWGKIKKNISNKVNITEISLRNGDLIDCRGCKYEDCLHFGENGDCFYGGVMVEKVYPAIIKCDSLVMICPNYNDAVSANITAFINRLTAVFRANDFSKKKIYAVVISGYSGGDVVAEQIISAMNFNKNFILPGNFAMVETANNPGSIRAIKDIDVKAYQFANKING